VAENARKPRRVLVQGISGSGKTTFGAELARRLGVAFLELDSLNHRANWTEATPEELRAAVLPTVESEAWVIDGSYRSKLGSLVLERADTVVWLDLPLTLTMVRLLRRTFVRLVKREELWAVGNRESLRGAFWGSESLFGFALRSRRTNRATLPVLYAAHPHAELVHLRSARAVDAYLRHAG